MITTRKRTDLRPMLQGYLECALWSSTCEPAPGESDGEPMDAHYTPEDIAAEALAEIKADVAAFAFANRHDLRIYGEGFREGCRPGWSRAGHDFWLTRNRHGAGFWDRTCAPGILRDACMRLSDASKVYGASDLYEGDDGSLYVS